MLVHLMTMILRCEVCERSLGALQAPTSTWMAAFRAGFWLLLVVVIVIDVLVLLLFVVVVVVILLLVVVLVIALVHGTCWCWWL